MQLTRHQGRVGGVLQEGNLLIVDRKVGAEEEAEVRLQMSLLNNRWEELRVQAMQRQAKYVHIGRLIPRGRGLCARVDRAD